MNEQTERLVHDARWRLLLGTATKRDLVLLVLADDRWHGGWSIAKQTGSMRYGARMWELRQHGVEIEKRLDPGRPKGECWWQYRLKEELPCSAERGLAS